MLVGIGILLVTTADRRWIIEDELVHVPNWLVITICCRASISDSTFLLKLLIFESVRRGMWIGVVVVVIGAVFGKVVLSDG